VFLLFLNKHFSSNFAAPPRAALQLLQSANQKLNEYLKIVKNLYLFSDGNIARIMGDTLWVALEEAFGYDISKEFLFN
jgi:hypothetical protein